jgi:indole-3-acetate monooxygenase
MPDTEVGAALLETARALRPRILAERDRIEAARRLPQELARELARAGFFRIYLPEAYGGLDLDPMAAMEIFEELARADASVAWCVWNGNTHWTTVQLAPEVAGAIHADPEVIIANSTRASGKADVGEAGYRVSGRWSLVSGCQLAEWIILLCVVHQDGTPRVSASGAYENRFMLCHAADCEIVDTWTVGGLRGTGSHDVVIRDLFVPAPYASSPADPIVLPGSRYRFPLPSRVGSGLGAMALGVARCAIETLVELAVAKRPDRSAQRLCEDRGAQTRLSQAEALVRSARLFLFESVSELWSEVITKGEATMKARAHVSLAKSHAVSSAAQAIDLLYLTGGATSLYATCPLERAFRDVHAITQHVGVHPRQLEATGRVLFGLDPEVNALI